MFKKSLAYYDSRERLLKQFAILYNKYFDFRKLLVNRKSDGKLVYVRKYLCPRIELFKFKPEDTPFKPVRNVTVRKRPDRVLKMLEKRLADIVADDTNSRELMRAAQTIVAYLQQKLLDIDPCNRIGGAMIMELERAKDTIWQTNQDFEEQTTFEKRLLYRLMWKYGISAPPLDCPF